MLAIAGAIAWWLIKAVRRDASRKAFAAGRARGRRQARHRRR